MRPRVEGVLGKCVITRCRLHARRPGGEQEHNAAAFPFLSKQALDHDYFNKTSLLPGAHSVLTPLQDISKQGV